MARLVLSDICTRVRERMGLRKFEFAKVLGISKQYITNIENMDGDQMHGSLRFCRLLWPHLIEEEREEIVKIILRKVLGNTYGPR